MDRLQISSAVPADLAEVWSDSLRNEPPTDKELDDALAELVMDIEHGKTVGGMDLEACLDCELNKTETGQAFIRDLVKAIGNPYDPEDCAAGYRIRVSEWLDKVVAAHIPQAAIMERALDRMEDE